MLFMAIPHHDQLLAVAHAFVLSPFRQLIVLTA
jgi:hypothetical protein